MKRKLSKITAMILAIIMAAASLSVTAFADDEDSSDDSTSTRAESYTWDFGYSTAGTRYYFNDGSTSAGWVYTDNGGYGAVYVDASSGKFTNYDRSDQWCQINSGTILYLPADVLTKITINTYSASATYSINSTTYTASSKYIEYTVGSSDELTTLIFTDEVSYTYLKVECTYNDYISTIVADNSKVGTSKDTTTTYKLSGEITCDTSGVASTVTSVTFTDVEYNDTHTASTADGTITTTDGTTTYEIDVPAGDYETSVSGADGYTTYDRVLVEDSDTTNEVYLESDDTAVTTYTLYDEIQDSSTALTFTNFSAHSSSTVSGGVGATIKVPVSSGKTVVVTGYYDGEFTITGSSESGTAANSGTSLTATYYTVSGDEYVTIEVTAVGNVASGSQSAYINTVVISTTPTTVEYTSSISVPGDYDTVTEAIAAVKAMERESSEDYRVTINLKADCQEQVLVDTDYVTINGNGHEINWYYGIANKYYSVDSNGYYSETLFRDKYEMSSTATAFWGGVVIVTGDYFRGEDVTFKNTYNYYVTSKELEDGAVCGTYTESSTGETKSYTVSDRTEDLDVKAYSEKERANALSIKGDYAELYNCSILSAQDTLGYNGELTNHAYFKNCTIGGNVDYICGAGYMVFDDCTLQWYVQTSQTSSLGYITAPKSYPYVFRNCKITVSDETTSLQGYYGRSWDTDATAYFIGCETNGYINSTGWNDSLNSSYPLSGTYFYEYGNTSNGKAIESTAASSTKGGILTNSSDELAKVINDDIITNCLGGWEPANYESKFAANVFNYSTEVTDSDSGNLLVYGNLPSTYTDDVAEVGIYFTTDDDKTDFSSGFNSNAADTSTVVYSTITFGESETSHTDSNGGYVYGAVISDISSYNGDTIYYVYTYITTVDGDTLYSTGTAINS
ncbi:MAG: pectinesterase family protein [Clostridiales bacterium]|nr:pectinesterase family protein [Clostridiales bacterium]